MTAPASPSIAHHADPFGVRHRRDMPAGSEEVLTLRPDLTHAGLFEFALRERVGRLASFRHAGFVTITGLERGADERGSVAVVSHMSGGRRLTALLAAAAEGLATIPPRRALAAIARVLDGVAALHAYDRDLAHGAIGPAQIVVTDSGEPLIADYGFGSAIEQLGYPIDRLWSELGVAAREPQAPFDTATDVFQTGVLAATLLLQRPLLPAELPGNRARLRAIVNAVGPILGAETAAYGWLLRAVRLEEPFASAAAARDALNALLMRDPEASADVLPVYPAAADRPIEVAPPQAIAANSVAPHEQDVAIDAGEAVPAPIADASITEGNVEPPTVVEPARAAVAAAEAEEDRRGTARRLSGTPEPSRRVEAPRLRVPVLAKAAAAIAIAAAGSGYGIHIGRVPIAVRALAQPHANAPASVDQAGFAPVPFAGPGRTTAGEHGTAGSTPGHVAAPGGQPSPVAPAPARARGGVLHVHTQPAGALVSIDGVQAGRSPVVRDDIAPGEHVVAIASEFGSVRQTVSVAAGESTSVVVPLRSTAAPTAGWVTVSAPFDVQLFEEGRLVATNATGRAMVAAGPHEIDIVNANLGFSAHRVVRVVAGQTAAVTVQAPQGTLAVNAAPWAEVWLDGGRVGETPLGNVAIPIGTHDLVFRHPLLEEQHRTVTVPVSGITRVSVDLRRK